MSFLGEVKRRKVFQVAAVYAVVAWLLIQVVDVIGEPLNLPDWFATVTIVLLAIGFPIAVILAWAFDITPEGVVRDQGSESSLGATGRRLEHVFVVVLVVAVATLLYREFTPTVESNASGLLPNSIAVLPFENLSPDPDDAYFAAGIHEQLVTELAKIQDLNIIARTTMLRYSDSPPPIPDIASELRVETVMEGSVRYAGDQVRVTAQLIDGRTGVHLWTEDFDGDLTDIFGIQSAIATLIANALEAELTPEEQQGLERQLTSSPQALALYLGAISVTDTDSAIPVLEEATRIDSEFAAAYGLLAFYQAVSINGFFSISPDDGPRMVREAQSNARQALFLDPSLGVAHAALGAIHLANWRAQDAEDSLRLAIELSPSAVGVAQMYARFKRHRREYGEAIELMERVVELDPNNAARQQNLGVAYRYAGDYDRAVVAFLDGLNLEPSSVSLTVNLAIAEAGRGDFDKAIQALQRAEILAGSDQGLETFRIPQMARIYSIVGRPDDAMRLFSVLQERARRQPIGEAVWAAAYSAIGDHETALRHLDVALDERLPTDAAMLGQLAANVFVDPVIETDPRYRERLGRLWDDEG